MITLSLKSGWLSQSAPYLYFGTGLAGLGSVEIWPVQMVTGLMLATGSMLLWRRHRQKKRPSPAANNCTCTYAGACTIACATAGQGRAQQQIAWLTKLVWRSSFNLGIAAIDAQHRSLFSISNALMDALLALESKTIIDAQIDMLIERVTTFFETKERLLAQNGRRLPKESLLAHQAFIVQMEKKRNLYRLGQLSRTELVGFITHDVIAAHALTTCFESSFPQRTWIAPKPQRKFPLYG